jgi:hypothetical protein
MLMIFKKILAVTIIILFMLVCFKIVHAGTSYVDHIRITVYYTLSTSGGPVMMMGMPF